MQSKHDPIHLLKKLPIWGAGKNGSVIKNSHCCYRGPKFGSQHPHFSSAGLRVSESQVQTVPMLRWFSLHFPNFAMASDMYSVICQGNTHSRLEFWSFPWAGEMQLTIFQDAGVRQPTGIPWVTSPLYTAGPAELDSQAATVLNAFSTHHFQFMVQGLLWLSGS